MVCDFIPLILGLLLKYGGDGINYRYPWLTLHQVIVERI